MKNKITGRIIVAGIATLLTLGLTQPAAAETMEKPASLSMAAAPTSMTSTVGEVGILSAWQHNTYVNYFTSKDTCNKRGYALVNYDPDFVGKVINWQCHKRSGDSRWSMDTLWVT